MHPIETNTPSPKNSQSSPRSIFRIANNLQNQKSQQRLSRQTSSKTLIRQPEWLTLALDSLPLKLRRELMKLVDTLEAKIVMLESEVMKLQEQMACSVGNLTTELKKFQLTTRQLTQEYHNKDQLQKATDELVSFMENNAQHNKKLKEVRKIKEEQTKNREIIEVNQLRIRKLQSQNKLFEQNVTNLQNQVRLAKSIKIRNTIASKSPEKQTQKYSLFKRQFNKSPQEKSSKLQRRSSILKPPTQRPKLSSPDESAEFGKEKVIEKKRVRILLQEFMKANRQDEAIDRLGILCDQIGCSVSQTSQLCAYL